MVHRVCALERSLHKLKQEIKMAVRQRHQLTDFHLHLKPARPHQSIINEVGPVGHSFTHRKSMVRKSQEKIRIYWETRK